MKTWSILFLSAALVLVLAGLTWVNPVGAAAPTKVSGYKIAICPLQITGGRGSAKKVMPEAYNDLFENEGFDVLMGVPVEEAMQKLDIRTTETAMPTTKEMLKLGQRLGVDYVLAAAHKVDTKRIIVNLLPRARSRITIDPLIVDVKKKEVVYSPKDKVGVARGGSNLQTGVGWVISFPVAIFMGGSRSKAERQAAEKTVKVVYQDFFDSFTKSQKKIE